jgi:uncharacterized protein
VGLTNALLLNRISHVRRYPKYYALTHSTFSLCIDIDAPFENALLKHNRFGLMSLYDKDYGEGQESLREWFNRATGAKETGANGKTFLVTMPRILGFGFNPVSFWLNFKEDDLVLCMAEVNNTFGERHCYILQKPDSSPITAQDTLTSDKMFHVSPLMTIEGHYEFRFSVTENKVIIKIDLIQAAGKILLTLQSGVINPLNTKTLLKEFLKPHQTLKVLAFIHWHALKLLIKRVKFVKKPAPPKTLIS